MVGWTQGKQQQQQHQRKDNNNIHKHRQDVGENSAKKEWERRQKFYRKVKHRAWVVFVGDLATLWDE